MAAETASSLPQRSDLKIFKASEAKELLEGGLASQEVRTARAARHLNGMQT